MHGQKDVIAEKILEKRIREKGTDRKKSVDILPGLDKALKDLINPATWGDLMSSFLWTSKSLRKLSNELKEKGYDTSYRTVRILLRDMGYNLKSNRKVNEGNVIQYGIYDMKINERCVKVGILTTVS